MLTDTESKKQLLDKILWVHMYIKTKTNKNNVSSPISMFLFL